MTEDQTGAPMDGDAELLDLLAGLSDTELDTALAGLPDAAIEPLLARLGQGTRYTAESPLDQARVIDATFRTRPHLRYLSDRLAQAVQDVEGGTSRFLVVSMPPRMGKQIADSVPVLTTRGWTTHGDLNVGDEVFSPSGLPVRVQGVSAPSEEKVRVVFTDGSEVACHPLHEWVVFDRSRGAWRTVETRYLMSRELWNGPHGARGGRATFQLPPVSPVQFPHREYLPVDPYTLGVWLGDGTASKASICGAEEDLNLIMARVPYELGARWVHPDTGVHYQYVKGGFLAALRSAGVLGDKHVPEQYLLASEDQRRALLAGLVDTDGTVDVTGRVTVSSSSHRLASGIRALVRSLGYRAGLVAVPADTREGRAIRGGPYWAVSWTIHDGIPAGAALQRKRGTWTKIKRRVGIAAIEPAPDELGRCIQVEGGVYLVGDALLPTHNSSLCSIYLPTWVLARHPAWKLGLISHSPTLSTSWGRQVRRMVENPALDLGVSLAPDAGAVAQWETTAGGSVSARSMPGQSVTGLGFKVLLIDDPVKDIAAAHSLTAREANWDWWQANAVTRMEHPALVVVIGCLTADTPVLMASGEQRRIDKVAAGDRVVTYTEDGQICTSVVRNHANVGADHVYTVTMASGRTVRANDRHPFLVQDEDGVRRWVRTDELQAGHAIVTLPGVRGPGSTAQPTGAASPSRPRGCAGPTTTKPDGLPVTAATPLRRPAKRISGTGTGWTWSTTSRCWIPRGVRALSVDENRTLATLAAGESCSLTTATTKAPFAGFSATTATSSLGTGLQLNVSWPQPITCATDRVVSVEVTGHEDVYDLEVEGTHTFVANGLVTHNTRWHEDDLIGRLLSQEYGDPAQDWEVIEFPAIAEVDDVLGRTPGQPLLSPLVENETEEQALERWAGLRSAVGSYNWSALYQQRPSPAEGAIFNANWWRYWTTNPANATADGRVVYVDPLDPQLLPDGSTPTNASTTPARRSEGEWLDSWDCAFKGTDTSDFVVGQRWLRRGQYRYLIDQRRGRWTFTQTLDQIEGFSTGGAFGDRVHRILVEDKANGTAVMDVMRDRLTGLTPISPKDGKEVRARAVTPEVESGHVLLPYPGDPGNEWVSDLLSEARNFPNTAHDDQVDALTQALNYLRNTTGRSGGISNPAQHGRRPAGGSLAAARRQSGARPGSGLSGVRR